jgi:hypothetical protein
MKQSHDFSKGKRGRIIAPKPAPRGKTRITIRLDEDLRHRAEQQAIKP